MENILCKIVHIRLDIEGRHRETERKKKMPSTGSYWCIFSACPSNVT
jgi:hypothetical protein